MSPGVAAAGPDKPASGPVYRNIVAKDGFVKPDASSLYDSFQSAVRRFPDRPCLGRRVAGPDGKVGEYVFETYAQVSARAAALAAGLAELGVKPHDKVGVFGANCPEWMIAMQARSMGLRGGKEGEGGGGGGGRGWHVGSLTARPVPCPTAARGLSLQPFIRLAPPPFFFLL